MRRPGYVGKPMPGVRLTIVDATGEPGADGPRRAAGHEAAGVVMMRTVWDDQERYDSYWNERLGGYVTGDIAVFDAEGY